VATLPFGVCGSNTLQVFDDGTGPKLYAGGFFRTVNSPGDPPLGDAHGIAAFDGETWSTVGDGAGGGANACNNFGAVESMVVFDDGSGPALYVSGLFDSMDGVASAGIARWNGVEWQSVGNATEARIMKSTCCACWTTAAVRPSMSPA
jgi:hypothetical protein